MDLSLEYLRELAPWLPDSEQELRRVYDMAGIEVKNLDASAISVELLANRGDHRCVEGVLREVAAYLRPTSVSGCFVAELPLTDDRTWNNDGRSVVAPSDLVSHYEIAQAMMVPGADGRLSDAELGLIELAGLAVNVRTIVAATNVVNLELGQPLHAYDADCVVGDVVVGLTVGGEQIQLVHDEHVRTLPEGILVVRDREKVLAIAGVMGSVDSAVGLGTTNVLIESAAFDPVLVRRSAQRLRVSSLASQRFERGSDRDLCRRALRRLFALLQAAGASVEVEHVSVVRAAVAPRIVSLSGAEVSAALGTRVEDRSVRDILERYGYRSTDLGYRVPSWRLYDVHEAADLVEDVARALDYNTIDESVPSGVVGSVPTPVEASIEQMNRILSDRGFYEVIGDTFQNNEALTPFRGFSTEPTDRRGELLQLSNSVDPGNGLLRRSTLPTALGIASENARAGVAEGRVFEWARVYAPQKGDWPVREDEVLWFAMFSRGANGAGLFPTVRRVIEDLDDVFGTTVTLEPIDVGAMSALHRRQSAEVVINSERVGLIGSIAEPLLLRLGAGLAGMVYVEFDVSTLLSAITAERSRPLAPIRSGNAMRRQLSYYLGQEFHIGRLLDALRTAADRLEQKVDVVLDSTYDGGDMRSATVSIDFDRTEWPDRASASDEALRIGREAEAALANSVSLRASTQ